MKRQRRTRSTPEITVLLPFFNEEGWLGKTLDSLAAQQGAAFRLLLIDNASTDGSVAEARVALAAHPAVDAKLLTVPTPGKTHALAAGLAAVETAVVAVCDADTVYPPGYLALALALFAANPTAAAVMAIDLQQPPSTPGARRRVGQVLRKARRLPDRCHAGGYAQAYRTAALRAAGGFDALLWPYVLEDHEVIHRLHAYGGSVYDVEHVCFSSARRSDRRRVSWNTFERQLYRQLPRSSMDWFFYRFLGPRLARRGAFAAALREHPWT